MTEGNIRKLHTLARQRGKAFRILIVDDEEWIRDLFEDFCSLTEAFEIDTAQSGDEALTKLGSAPYDLVTLDLIMPEMSGLEALVSIKEASPRVPVMIITGNATDKLVREAGVLGACRVLYKPVQLSEFIDQIARTLTSHNRSGESAG